MREREQATEVPLLAVGFAVEAFLEPVPLRLDDPERDVARVRRPLLQPLFDRGRLAFSLMDVCEHALTFVIVKFGQPERLDGRLAHLVV